MKASSTKDSHHDTDDDDDGDDEIQSLRIVMSPHSLSDAVPSVR